MKIVSDITKIKLEGVSKNDIDKFIGQTFRILSHKEIRVGENTIAVETEEPLKISFNKALRLSKKSFKGTTRISEINKSIVDPKDDAFCVILEDNKLGIIFKDTLMASTHGYNPPPPSTQSKETKQ